ncbi:hypothetical protein PYW07_009306 [Mythimna separata]|uniref:Peptidase S1 domain-containing protein n=1 Tax=Mythimna separata TaxID=271217 RepID=A0AAD8DN62_MYTSE|nr:hypothetical protein PYW07_009306 [Mythimna separata]
MTGNDSDNNVLNSIESWQMSGRRIFSGIRSKIEVFPFMASVQFFNKFQCGGSIIKSDLVITSASCLQLAWNNRLYRENPLFLSVQVGSTLYERGGENIPVMQVHFHPSFNPKTLQHNLALMRLRRKLKFNKKRRSKVKKIDFDRNPWTLPENVGNIVIIGWGVKTFGANTVNLQKNRISYANLDYYPLKECQEIYTKEFVTDRNFCAGFFSKGGGACNHDAGGPGVISGILTGVISFGSPQCGSRDAPTVFTKLGYYTDWIEEIMELPYSTGHQATTQREVVFPMFSPPTFKKTTPFKITPIVFKDPIKDNRFSESLRTKDNMTNNKEPEFKDFLKTMFKKKKQKAQPQIQKEEQEKEFPSLLEETAEDVKEQEQEKEFDSLLEETNQGVKEEDKFEIEQTLRHKPKMKTEKGRKPLSKPKSKGKIETTIESLSQSKEADDDFADETTTIRPQTTLETVKVTSLLKHYTATSTPLNKHKDRNVTNVTFSSQEQDFDEAIENLIDNLNIDYILESQISSPKNSSSEKSSAKKSHEMRAKDQLSNNTESDESNLEIDEENIKEEESISVVDNEENQSDAIYSNENENEKRDSGGNVSDGEDSYSEKNYEEDINESNLDKTVETADRNQSVDSVQDDINDNNTNKQSEQVELIVNTDDEIKDLESDDGGETNEGSEGINDPTKELEQEHSSNSNSTERLLEMMEYEDLYKLLMRDT